MKKSLLVLFLIASFSAANADELKSVVSGGGGTIKGASSTTYTIQSEPVIGRIVSGTTTLIIGSGALFGVAGPGPQPGDNGKINQSVISRNGDNPGDGIKINWNYNDQNVTGVDIWRLSGGAKQYSAADSAWKIIATMNRNAGTMWEDKIDDDKDGNIDILVGNTVNAYYRVVPLGTARADIFKPENNARTLGKVDLSVFRDNKIISYSRISIPLVQYSDEWDAVIGGQLAAGSKPADSDQIQKWIGTGWEQMYYQGGWRSSGGSFKHSFGEGYLVRIPERSPQPRTASVTTVGYLAIEDYESDKYFGKLAKDKYSSPGDPYPINSPLDNSGLRDSGAFASDKPAEADQVQKWTGLGWEQMYLNKTTAQWRHPSDQTKVFGLEIGQGYLYRKGDANTGTGYNWKYVKPY